MPIFKIQVFKNELDDPKIRLFIIIFREKKIHHRNSHKFSVLQLTEELIRQFGLKLHLSTVRRYLIKHGLYGPWKRNSKNEENSRAYENA